MSNVEGIRNWVFGIGKENHNEQRTQGILNVEIVDLIIKEMIVLQETKPETINDKPETYIVYSILGNYKLTNYKLQN